MFVVVARILEGMFVLGSAGCVLVFILTSIDDLKVLLGGGAHNGSAEAASNAVEAQHNLPHA